MIAYETHDVLSHVLTPEGSYIVLHGSHEARVWAALPEKGAGEPVSPAQLKSLVGEDTAKVGQGRAFKNGWIAKEGAGLIKAVRPPQSLVQRIPQSPHLEILDRRCHPIRPAGSGRERDFGRRREGPRRSAKAQACHPEVSVGRLSSLPILNDP